MRTLTTRTWNPLNIFDTFDNFFTPYEKFDFMKTDIKEKENEFVLDVELAGFDKKEISLDYENNYLTVKAERKEKDNNQEKILRKERNLSYMRSYYLGDVDESGIKAKYENGVLTVSVPKLSAKKIEKSRIEIE